MEWLFSYNEDDEMKIMFDGYTIVRFKFSSSTAGYTPTFHNGLKVSTDMENAVAVWPNPGLHLKTWISHLNDVVEAWETYIRVSPRLNRLPDFELLSHILRSAGLRILSLDLCSDGHVVFKKKEGDKGFHKILSAAENIDIKQDIYESSELTHQVMIQNFEKMETKFIHKGLLNSLLASNAVVLSATCSKVTFPMEDFNLFLKSWMNGSNQQMRELSFKYSTDIRNNKLVVDSLLKGIRYQQEPVDNNVDELSVHYTSMGSFGIKRDDGCEATIAISSSRRPNRSFDYFFYISASNVA